MISLFSSSVSKKIFAIFALGIVSLPGLALAQSSGAIGSVQSGLTATAGAGRLSDFCDGQNATACIANIAGNVVRVALGFTGIILLGYLIYAGFLWMTSGGESDKAKEAMTMIRNAVIGLVILVASFAIASYVLTALSNIAAGRATAPSTPVTVPATPPTPPR